MRQNVLRSAAMLTLSGIIAKTVDFLLRASYSQKLGGEGMGIFSLVFSVHGIMLTLATGGVGVAVSKTISEQIAAHNPSGVKKTMQIALGTVVCLAVPVIAVVFLFSSQIADKLLGDIRAAKSIVCLAPSILFMGISYCIKGYFYASRCVLRPASSEFLEQAVKVGTVNLLLPKLLPLGIEHGCEAVFIGLSIGEAASCLYLSLLYAADSAKLRGGTAPRGLLMSIARVALPITASSLAGSFMRMQEGVWIVSGLEKSGLCHTDALSTYGSVHGMIMPLLLFPLTLMSSCLTLLVPEISRAAALSHRIRLQTLTARIYRFTACLGFMTMCIYIAFSPELSYIVYDAPALAPRLRILAFLTPIMIADSVSCGILNGIGAQGFLLRLSLSDSAIRLFLVSVLVPHFGIGSVIFIIIFSNIFTCTLSFRRASKLSGISLELEALVIKPCIAAFAATLAVHVLYNRFARICSIPTLCAGAFGLVTVYLCVSTYLGSPSRADISWIVRRMISDKL